MRNHVKIQCNQNNKHTIDSLPASLIAWKMEGKRNRYFIRILLHQSGNVNFSWHHDKQMMYFIYIKFHSGCI